jgi:hypothetical protein
MIEPKTPAPGAKTDAKALAASCASELRSSLARVELAASQLGREVQTPAARDLARTISAAVGQADRQLDRIVALLAPQARVGRGVEDARSVLARLRGRIAPVLAARGTACELRAWGREPLRADPVLVERVALALVRIASALAGPEGRLWMALDREGEQVGVVVGCAPADGRALPEDPERAFAGLLPLAVRHGGTLAGGPAGSGWQATLWLPGGEA